MQAPSLLTAKSALALAALAALGLAAAPARAQTTLNFDNFTASSADGPQFIAPTYSDQGFTLTSGSAGFFALNGSDPTFGDGETSLYNSFGATTLMQDSGAAFTLNAIDLGPLNGNSAGTTNDGPILFTGTRADGTTVTATETTTDPNGQFQTFTFSGFDNLTSLTFTSTDGPTSSQFDNVVLDQPAAPSAAPEPSQVAALGFTALGLGGLLLRARKRHVAPAA